MKGLGLTFTGIVLFFLVVIGFSSFYVVEPGEVSFEKRFGQISPGINTEGLHFKTPFVENVVITSIKDKKVTVDASSSSKDLQDVATTLSINYAISKDSVITLHQTIGDANQVANAIVGPSIQEAVKSATAKFTASELITRRTEVRDLITESLKQKLSARGLVLSEVNIENFQFSKSFNAAIEAKVQAEQEAAKARNDLETVKAEAQADIERSRAEAEKIKIQAEAVTSQGGAEYVELQKIQRRDGKLPQYMFGGAGGADTSFFLDLAK